MRFTVKKGGNRRIMKFIGERKRGIINYSSFGRISVEVHQFKIHKEFRCVAGNKRNETHGSRFIRNRTRFRCRASLQILLTHYRARDEAQEGEN